MSRAPARATSLKPMRQAKLKVVSSENDSSYEKLLINLYGCKVTSTFPNTLHVLSNLFHLVYSLSFGKTNLFLTGLNSSPSSLFFAAHSNKCNKNRKYFVKKICLSQYFLFPLQIQASFPSNERRKAHSMKEVLGLLKRNVQ